MRFFCLVWIAFVVLFASENIEQSDLYKKKDNLQKEQAPSSWIHSVGMIVSYFDNGNMTQGYGVLLKEGYFITASNLVYNHQEYPKDIYVKMQDDSAKPLICVAKLQVKAIDEQKGLALLKTVAYTDDYCKERGQSFYHKRIYELYSLNPFLYPVNTFFIDSVQNFEDFGFLYPNIGKQYTFSVNKIIKARKITYFDKNFKQNIFYAYLPENNLDQQRELGKPFFDAKNVLVGLYAVTSYEKEAVIVNSNFIKSFLCSLQADFELSTWNKEDCRNFQQNLLKNMESITKQKTK